MSAEPALPNEVDWETECLLSWKLRAQKAESALVERDRELQQVKEWKHNALVAMDADKEVIDRLIRELQQAREELVRLKDGMHQVILVLSSKGDAPQSKAIKMLADLKTWVPEKPDTKGKS